MITSTSSSGKAALLRTLRWYSSNGREVARQQRELLIDVLSADASKRDAKQYLSRFQSPRRVAEQHLYGPARAISHSPKFRDEATPVSTPERLHTAIVCLRDAHELDDSTLDGLVVTLTQLSKLDMKLVLVLDDTEAKDTQTTQLRFLEQAERLSIAIGRHGDGARIITRAFIQDVRQDDNLSAPLPELILTPLTRGLISILPCLAHTPRGQLTSTTSHSTILTLTILLSRTTSLDRILLLNKSGGLPTLTNNTHIFINLSQEYSSIQAALSEHGTPLQQSDLKTLKESLSLLPASSSGLIVSPLEAAASSREEEDSLLPATRRQKNTLIHNLLTNRPWVSSSLPKARVRDTERRSATVVKWGMELKILPEVGIGGWGYPGGVSLRGERGLDFEKLVELIEDSFQRKLDVERYLERIDGRTAGVVVAGEYEGAAVFTWEGPLGGSGAAPVPYLDKLAVRRSSQGSAGVADLLFQAMVQRCFPHGVCWRSRRDNPANGWYKERAGGWWELPGGKWVVFWTGDNGWEKFGEYVAVGEGVGGSWKD